MEEVYKLASQQAQAPIEAANKNASVPPPDFPLEKLSQTTHHQKVELVDISSFNYSSSLHQTANSGSNTEISLALGLQFGNLFFF